MRSRLRTLAKFVLGLAAGSLAFEVYLRTVEATPLGRVLPVAEVALYGPSVHAGYTHRPGASGIWLTENRSTVEINALGLRDAPGRTRVPLDGTRRFAVAGDSIVEALQVARLETFTALSELELGRRTGSRVEVLNLGLSGARPAVLVERLRWAAQHLAIEGAVVSVAAGDLLAGSEDDASEFAGYVQGPSGRAIISHAFREGRGFKLRTSATGGAIYWTLDHVRLALILNNRRNAGIMAELAPAAPPRKVSAPSPCIAETLEPYEALWNRSASEFANARLDAFLSDLANLSQERRIPVVVALRGPGTDCPTLSERRQHLAATAGKRISSAGLAFLDHELALDRIPGASPRSALFGFGARTGYGHLNVDGHRLYAAVLVETIERYLLRR